MMDYHVRVELSEIRRATEILLQHLEALQGPTLSLETDMFWSIPQESRVNLYEDPSEFTVGQVSDSLENIRRIVSGESDPIAYACVWLGDIFRAIGEETRG